MYLPNRLLILLFFADSDNFEIDSAKKRYIFESYRCSRQGLYLTVHTLTLLDKNRIKYLQSHMPLTEYRCRDNFIRFKVKSELTREVVSLITIIMSRRHLDT